MNEEVCAEIQLIKWSPQVDNSRSAAVYLELQLTPEGAHTFVK